MSACPNVKECACPKGTCNNNRKCCACVIKHKETDSVPYCLFLDNGGDKSVKNYYRVLKKRFEYKDTVQISNPSKVIIDYLYLDLNQCERCIGTDKVLDEVLETLTPSLRLAGYEVIENKIEMLTPELAMQYKFLSSPTIRVNGKDICLSVEENDCSCCSDIAGANVECRVFRYNDETYEVPPKEMLANAILQTLFSSQIDETNCDYVMPENLKSFYSNKNNKGDRTMKTLTIFEPAMCCPTGICGVGVNPDLLRLSAVLDNLKKNGVKVNRYNLNSAPRQFIQHAEVNKLINEKGTDILPIFMFDDKIEITGRYPTNAEIVMYLNISPEFLEAPKQSGCGCGGNTERLLLKE